MIANTSPTFKLSGDVSLLSHYVEYGLSQTDKDPSLQGSFWFNFGPQFRMGLWGSNVKFPGGDDHFNLRLNADLKVDFSKESHAIIAYSQSQYYSNGDRNGNILGLHLKFGTYRVTYDGLSNWEGTDERSVRFGLGKDFDIFTTWKWLNEIGYNTPNVSNINPYFDLRTGIGTKAGVIFIQAAVSATSEPGQFNGAGDIFLILSASTSL
ncbi:putative bacterial protein [compost metagenome]